MKKAMNVSQCENGSKSKPSSEVLVSDLCSRLNVAGISDVCEVLNEDDLMIGGYDSWL